MALLLTRFDFIFSVWASCYCFAYLLFIHILLYSYPRAPRRCFITPGAVFIYVYLFVINGIGGDNAAQVKYGLHVALYANLNFPCYATERTVFCFSVCHILLFVSWRKHQCEWYWCPRQISLWGNERVCFFSLSFHLNYLDFFFFCLKHIITFSVFLRSGATNVTLKMSQNYASAKQRTKRKCHRWFSTVITEIVAGGLSALTMYLGLSLSAVMGEWTGNTWCMSDSVSRCCSSCFSDAFSTNGVGGGGVHAFCVLLLSDNIRRHYGHTSDLVRWLAEDTKACCRVHIKSVLFWKEKKRYKWHWHWNNGLKKH